MTDVCRLVFVFIMPIGLTNIGWKMYMVNASWDIVILALIVSCLLPKGIFLMADGSSGTTGLRLKERRSRKSMHCLMAKNTPLFLT